LQAARRTQPGVYSVLRIQVAGNDARGAVRSLASRFRNPLGVVASFLTILLLASPITTATFSVRDAAPYTSATTFATNVTVLVQNPLHPTCANATLSIPPTGYTSNGSEFVASESMAHTWRNCSAFVTTSAGFLGPSFNSTLSHRVTVTYTWKVPWSIKGRASGGGSNFVNISVFGNLFDNTTHSWALGGNLSRSEVVVVLNRTDVRGLTTISGVSLSVNVSFVVTLSSGHQYLFYTGLYTQSFAKTVAGNALAKLDVGSARGGARVISMRVA
jgi:hypothetical protein